MAGPLLKQIRLYLLFLVPYAIGKLTICLKHRSRFATLCREDSSLPRTVGTNSEPTFVLHAGGQRVHEKPALLLLFSQTWSTQCLLPSDLTAAGLQAAWLSLQGLWYCLLRYHVDLFARNYAMV